MHRVLLTSVVRPFGGAGEGDSVGAELFHAQVTRAQGPFSLRQVIRVWGLDLIAENITAPAVVLHYPSMAEFEAELRRGSYTHVGINFVVATFHKVRAMVRRIRELSPKSKIILGGYGTVLPDELLLPYGDAICREEGVGFMRRILGEDCSRPVQPAHSPVPSSSILGYQLQTVVGHVTAGLGCANGCDFCCTSHFFKRKYVRLHQSGADIYEAMMDTRKRARADGFSMDAFALIDEDFFLYRKRAEEFLEAVRRGGEPLSIFGFGSVKGLSQFKASEIAEMGFDLIWTAFEGKKSGYAKLNGRSMDELYADLRSHGVGCLSSMMIGFPYQDERAIWSEFDELMKLEPALAQFLIYFPFPGTPFFEEAVRDHRFLPQYEKSPDLRRWDGFALHLKHPHFTAEALEKLQKKLYEQDYHRLGPSVHRLASVWLRGAQQLATASSTLLRKRAERLRSDVRSVLPTVGSARLLLPTAEARARAELLEQGIVALTGPRSLRERIMSPLALGLGALAGVKTKYGILQQPGLLRVEHRTNGRTEEARTGEVLRLQGQGVPLWKRVAEDIHDQLLGRWRQPWQPAVMQTEAWQPIPETRGSVMPADMPRPPQPLAETRAHSTVIANANATTARRDREVAIPQSEAV